MRKHHPQNERIKREYFNYLEQAKRMSQNSVDLVAAADQEPKRHRPGPGRRRGKH